MVVVVRGECDVEKIVAAVVVNDGDAEGDADCDANSDADCDAIGVDSVVFFLTRTIPAARRGLMKMSEKEFGVTLMTFSVTTSLLLCKSFSSSSSSLVGSFRLSVFLCSILSV
jgi:hypothetical protein